MTFRGSEAALALPPTGAVEAARARLEQLPTGGRTPLTSGLQRVRKVIAIEPARSFSRPMRLAVAVFLGKARLIDNIGIAART